METTPRRHKHMDNTESAPPSSQKKRLNGLFRDGEWWCNCEPRQHAAHLQVRKEIPSKGQWFFNCRSRPQCDFFLWEDQANLRETGGLTHNGEEILRPKTPSFTQRPLTSFGIQVTPGGRRLSDSSADSIAVAMQIPCSPSSKRKRDAFDDDGDDFGHLNSDDERQLAVVADNSAKKSKPSPAALDNAPKDAYTTPTANRTVDTIAGLPTPSVTRTLFPKTDKRHKSVSFKYHPDSASTTPTVSNTTQPSATPSSIPPTKDDDMAEQILSLLHPQKLDPAVLKSVMALLETSARKMRGVELGRESARAAARSKDVKIARLQERVAALENKDRMNQSQLTDMKAGIMRVYQNN